MRADKFKVWITVESDNPDLQDIASANRQLLEMGLDNKGRVGIGFTRTQWVNFLRNLSRFEHGLVSMTPANVMGFDVRLIQEI